MRAYFDNWSPSADSIRYLGEFPSRSLYSSQSAPILLPGAETQVILPLFGCASSSGNTPDSGDCCSREDVLDSVQHVGGAVWALNWCPSDVHMHEKGTRGSTDLFVQYLAVGCHPLQSVHNLLGKAVQGPAMIQIWEAVRPDQSTEHGKQDLRHSPDRSVELEPVQQGSHAAAASVHRLPEMVMGIAHDGGLTWNCQWCPDAELADDLAGGTAGLKEWNLPRLGLLAAALGDGTLRIWAVPHPRLVQQRYSSSAVCGSAPFNGLNPPVVDVPPVAVISSRDLGGSMPSVMDWLPAKPHDLLLVGCWDGSVAIIKLNPSGASSGTAKQTQQQHCASRQQQQQPQGGGGAPSSRCWELVSFFPAEPIAVRAVRWIPAAVCGQTLDMVHRHVFLSAGHAGRLHIWDDRDQFQPLYQQTLSVTTALSAAWTSEPLGVLVAMEDASLRGVPLDASITCRQGDKLVLSHSWRGPGMGALWALDVHPSMQLVAYGGEDGEVGVFAAEYENRRRAPHTPVSGLAKEEDTLVVKSTAQMGNQHGIFRGKIVERQPALANSRFPREEEAVHRVAWWPGSTRGAWLASGGAAGLVRLQWIEMK